MTDRSLKSLAERALVGLGNALGNALDWFDERFPLWFGRVVAVVGGSLVLVSLFTWGDAGCWSVRGPGTEICDSNLSPWLLVLGLMGLFSGVGLVMTRRR